MSGLPTLHDALEWLRGAWEERETPTRLHQREHDGWGLMFAPAFARRLGASPWDMAHDHKVKDCDCPAEKRCGHPRVTGCACPWRYPTWRAMTLLCRRNRVAHDVILTLVINGYDVAGLAFLGFREGALLGAIRRLYDVYERGPVRPIGWVSKSESQRMAEAVA